MHDAAGGADGRACGSHPSAQRVARLACFHAAGHSARDASAAAASTGASCAGDERALDRPPPSAAWSRSHCPATTASWCSPSTSWTCSTAAANCLAGLPTAGATASAAYRHRLARMRTAWSSSSGGSSSRSSTASRSFFHGFAHEIAQLEVEARRDHRTTAWCARRGEQAVDEPGVARRPHRGEQLDRAPDPVLGAQTVEQALAGARSDVGQLGDPAVRGGRGARRRRAPCRAGRPTTSARRAVRCPTPGRRPGGTSAGRNGAAGWRRGPGAPLRGPRPAGRPDRWRAAASSSSRSRRGARRGASRRSRASAVRRGRAGRERGGRGRARSWGAARARRRRRHGSRSATRATSSAGQRRANSTSSSRKRAASRAPSSTDTSSSTSSASCLPSRSRSTTRWRAVFEARGQLERRVAHQRAARGRRPRREARPVRRRGGSRNGPARRRTRPAA